MIVRKRERDKIREEERERNREKERQRERQKNILRLKKTQNLTGEKETLPVRKRERLREKYTEIL